MTCFTMRLRYLILLGTYFNCILPSPITTTTENVEIFTAESIIENIENNSMKTITDLVRQQTEAIRKIISEQQKSKESAETKEINENSRPGHMENLSMEELKKKCEHFNKIVNHATLLEPQTLKLSTENPRTVKVIPSYMQPNLLNYRPKFSTPTTVNMPKAPQMSGNYFIFTQNPEMYEHRVNHFSDKADMVPAASSVEEDVMDPDANSDNIEYEDEEEMVTNSPDPEETTIKPQGPAVGITTINISPSTVSVPETTTVTPPKKPKFKYVRLEPIVLKAAILPTGRSTLFWYRLIPQSQSFVQIPDIPKYENVSVVAHPQNFNDEIALPQIYTFYIDPNTGSIKENTPIKFELPSPIISPPTTATIAPATYPAAQPQFFINPKTGMIYQSALPHQFIYQKIDKLTTPAPPTTTSTTTTTTEKIPLPSYTIDIPQPPPSPSKPLAQNEPKPTPAQSKKQFKHEFRFVIPMVVTGTQDQVSNYPYQLDPFAYLPKDQQPATMNLPVPYVPNYHMIHTLAVPNQFEGLAT